MKHQQGYVAADAQLAAMAGLNFDTVFETYIGPIPVVEGDDGTDSETGEPAGNGCRQFIAAITTQRGNQSSANSQCAVGGRPDIS